MTSQPLYRMDNADVSPKLATMFQDVRKRMLPGAARELYTKGKTSFDQKRYADASRQFKQLLQIIGDVDAADQSAALSDLKQLGDGFLRLSEAELSDAAKAAALRPAPPVETAASVPPAPRVYSASDVDVTPPMAIEKPVPRWVPPNRDLRQTTFRGTLELLIDERGVVESLTMRKSISKLYDPHLMAAAKKWHFTPAKKDGKPVKYMKLLEFVLSPPVE